MSQMAPHFFPLEGGLNLISPAITAPSGSAIAAKNYEPIERGYGFVAGFERYDGQPAPSDASYWILNFDAGSAAISEGDTVTGATSSATGKALIDAVVTSGSYGGADAAGYLVLTVVSGAFQNDENLQVSAATKCVADGTATERGASNDTDDTTWIRDAIETARALIAKPTGSGKTRGGFVYNGSRYCFRDNAGGTAGQLYKATTAGWVAQTFGRSVAFTSGGTTAIAEQDTITGATSSATATVERVILTSGTWAGGDAAGRLILSGQTGTFQSENLDTGSGSNLATIGGDSVAITLPAAGTYEVIIENFFGASDLECAYFVSTTGTAFEWDGSVLVPIVTGMTADTPDHIEAFRNHLFLSFPGGSLQNSSIGAPYTWSPVTGASEIGLGTDVTGLLDVIEAAMFVFGRNRVSVLYGDDSNNFELKRMSSDSGAIAGTVQRIGNPIYMDDRGIRDVSTTQAYGDFTIGTVSRLVEPLIRKKRAAGVTVKCSVRSRQKGQYRLFYSDGTGLTVFFGRKYPEILPFDLGVVVEWAVSADDSDGSEVLLIGDSDGWVYELDAGTSFDGSEIDAYLRLAFNHLRSPAYYKRFHKATLEVDCAGPTTLSMTSEFTYADPDQPSGSEIDFSVSGGGGFWDEDNWDQFYWSTAAEGTAETHIDGIGKNIGIAVLHRSTYEQPHVLHGLTLNYSRRRMAR